MTRRLALPFLALLAALALPQPALANHVFPIHFVNGAGVADSVALSMFTGKRATSQAFIAQNIAFSPIAALDSVKTLTNGGRKSLAVIAEVLGIINADCDSLYLAIDYSEDGGTRWYVGKDFVATPVNNTASATFIWLIPADPADYNSWIWHDRLRFRVGGPGTGTALGTLTRFTLQWRID